jgi:hypothetical protein
LPIRGEARIYPCEGIAAPAEKGRPARKVAFLEPAGHNSASGARRRRGKKKLPGRENQSAAPPVGRRKQRPQAQKGGRNMAKKKQQLPKEPEYDEQAEQQAELAAFRKQQEEEKKRRQGDLNFVPYRYLELGQKSKYLGFNGAEYDSRLIMRGGDNAELTLILRIFFKLVDPTPRGGSQRTATDGNHPPKEIELEEIEDHEWNMVRYKIVAQANAAWRGICLVTPNDWIGFDWPKENPTVRPNVNCSLQCEVAVCPSAAHHTVQLVKPAGGRFFRSFVNLHSLDDRISTWSITDLNRRNNGPALQDLKDRRKAPEDIWTSMAAHEVGHVLGLPHISGTLLVKSCRDQPNPCIEEVADIQEYGSWMSFPMWLARDVMGMGSVVHACNLRPWAAAMAAHTAKTTTSGRWIPAGVSIPPRAIKDIPKEPWTWKNSPYTGGTQEQSKY